MPGNARLRDLAHGSGPVARPLRSRAGRLRVERPAGGRASRRTASGPRAEEARRCARVCSRHRSASTSSAFAGRARDPLICACVSGSATSAGRAGLRCRWIPSTVRIPAAVRATEALRHPIRSGRVKPIESSTRSPRPGPVRDIRLHFVNSTGTATGLDRLRSGLRRAVSTAVSRVGSVFGADAGAQDAITTRDRDPRRVGRRCLPAARDTGVRRGQARVRPPHRDRERVHARAVPGDGARHLPLPPQLERLERHRLPVRRGQVRKDLRRARRWDRSCGGRSAGAGIQLPVGGHLQPRHVQHDRSDGSGACGTRASAFVEAGDPRRGAAGQGRLTSEGVRRTAVPPEPWSRSTRSRATATQTRRPARGTASMRSFPPCAEW